VQAQSIVNARGHFRAEVTRVDLHGVGSGYVQKVVTRASRTEAAGDPGDLAGRSYRERTGRSGEYAHGSMAVMGCPEKGPPWRPRGAFVLEGLGGSESMSTKGTAGRDHASGPLHTSPWSTARHCRPYRTGRSRWRGTSRPERAPETRPMPGSATGILLARYWPSSARRA
jgi:hypothetical protein